MICVNYPFPFSVIKSVGGNVCHLPEGVGQPGGGLVTLRVSIRALTASVTRRGTPALGRKGPRLSMAFSSRSRPWSRPKSAQCALNRSLDAAKRTYTHRTESPPGPQRGVHHRAPRVPSVQQACSTRVGKRILHDSRQMLKACSPIRSSSWGAILRPLGARGTGSAAAGRSRRPRARDADPRHGKSEGYCNGIAR